MTAEPVGQCHITRHTDQLGHHHYEITRADPHTRISADMLDHIGHNPAAPFHLNGDVFTIRTPARTVIYRIDWDDYDPQTDTYGAEWPD